MSLNHNELKAFLVKTISTYWYHLSLKKISHTWWSRQMETFSALLALCQGIHRSPVNSPHKDQWRRALKFSLICAWINGWVNNGDAGDLRRYRLHHDVIVMRNDRFHFICRSSALFLVDKHIYSNLIKGIQKHGKLIELLDIHMTHVFFCFIAYMVLLISLINLLLVELFAQE